MRPRLVAPWIACLFLALVVIGASSALGAERFPPPQFDSGYTMPSTTVPAPRAQGFEWLDVAVLAGALSLASYFVLVKRSRSQVFGLTVFSLLYFGFYRKGCICAIGSIQDVTLALFNHGYAVPLTVLAFFLLPLIFTLFFGRTFCAAVCPLGAIQDVVLLKPVRVRSWVEHALGLIPYFYLGAAVLFAATGSAFLICRFDPFVAFFRRSGSFPMLVWGAGLLAVGMYIGRPYCRFLCPYGAILRFLSRFAKWNVTLAPTDCLHCQLCDAACPFGAIRESSSSPEAPAPARSKLRLVLLLALVPVMMALGGVLGGRLATAFSQVHPTVQLSETVAGEEATQAQVPSDASRAFRQTGRPAQQLYADALQLRRQFLWGGWLLGAFVGFVIAGKLWALFYGTPHPVYEPDAGACVACGRCYNYCPKEQARLKKAQRPTEVVAQN